MTDVLLSPAGLLGLVLVAALALYTLTGGADFGGGVWELLASGPRKNKQRDAISTAIAPIWEANHVWLILAVVVLFAGFPPAFAAITTALHVPLVLLLMGIVLRGAAFTFRSYDTGPGQAERSARWSLVFAISSTVSPIMLGVCAGAVASGQLTIDAATGRVQTDFISAWLAPFPFAVGLMTLLLFAFLAAVYLCVEHRGTALADDFRTRALASGVLLAPAAGLAWNLSATGAPAIRAGLAESTWALPFHIGTGVFAMGALVLLVRRAYRKARLAAAAQAVCIVVGWALSQFPYVVVPDLTLTAAAAPDNVIVTMLVILAVGAIPLALAFRYLYAIFARA